MSLLDPDDARRLTAVLVLSAGGYLRNPIREPDETCKVCTTPVDGWSRCYVCSRVTSPDVADATAFLTYAVRDKQSGYVMRGYKAPRPVKEHVEIVAMMVWLALSMHQDCPAKLGRMPVTHWATVPSLPAKDGEHQLHHIVTSIGLGAEATLRAAADARYPRDVNPDHFMADNDLGDRSHVLLIDDTWASGGHAQSAAIALHRAGAARVSLLVVARWVNENFGDNAKFLRGLTGRDYDPAICPWTGGGCPSGRVVRRGR